MDTLRLLLGLCCLLLCGCDASRADDYRDVVAIDLALATMTDGQSPAPLPPQPYKCPRCKDTGVITHGDSHQTPCPDCQSGCAGACRIPAQAAVPSGPTCRGGQCPLALPPVTPPANEAATLSEQEDCVGFHRGRFLFWRFRR